MRTLFAQSLRSLRQKKTLTLTELAQRSGLSRRTVAYWEAGTTLPRIPELQAALNVMEATPEEAALLIDRIDMPRSERAAGEKQTLVGTGLSDLLRAMRHRHHLTQTEMAAQLRINRQAVLRWESGQNRISSENLERLCDLLHAAPEERQALRAHRLIMPHWAEEDWRRIRVEEAAHLWREMQRPHNNMAPDYQVHSPLFELQVLAMKRQLLLHTPPGVETRRLLANVETDHAIWLHFQHREHEARLCVKRAMLLIQEETVPQDFWGELLNLAAYPGYAAAKGGSFASLRVMKDWMPRLPSGIVRTQQLCDMALYTGLVGHRSEAIPWLEQAERSMDRAQGVTASETYYYAVTMERLHLAAGNTLEVSEGLLAQCPNNFQRIHLLLLWINTLLLSGERGAASRYLAQVQTLITPEAPARLHQTIMDYSMQI